MVVMKTCLLCIYHTSAPLQSIALATLLFLSCRNFLLRVSGGSMLHDDRCQENQSIFEICI